MSCESQLHLGCSGRVKQSNDVWIHIPEEGETRRDVGLENGALVLLHALSEESLWLLEPKVV